MEKPKKLTLKDLYPDKKVGLYIFKQVLRMCLYWMVFRYKVISDHKSDKRRIINDVEYNIHAYKYVEKLNWFMPTFWLFFLIVALLTFIWGGVSGFKGFFNISDGESSITIPENVKLRAWML